MASTQNWVVEFLRVKAQWDLLTDPFILDLYVTGTPKLVWACFMGLENLHADDVLILD